MLLLMVVCVCVCVCFNNEASLHEILHFSANFIYSKDLSNDLALKYSKLYSDVDAFLLHNLIGPSRAIHVNAASASDQCFVPQWGK